MMILQQNNELITHLSFFKEGEELSTEELFDQLRGRKLHLTLADIKRWDYIRLINEDAGDGEGEHTVCTRVPCAVFSSMTICRGVG